MNEYCCAGDARRLCGRAGNPGQWRACLGRTFLCRRVALAPVPDLPGPHARAPPHPPPSHPPTPPHPAPWSPLCSSACPAWTPARAGPPPGHITPPAARCPLPAATCQRCGAEPVVMPLAPATPATPPRDSCRQSFSLASCSVLLVCIGPWQLLAVRTCPLLVVPASASTERYLSPLTSCPHTTFMLLLGRRTHPLGSS